MTDINNLRHRCFFDICIGDKNVGRIIFELFNDICPKTCDNFRSLCTGEKGLGKTTGKALHYKNVKFHRVVKHFIIQSGDFSMGNGRGGESIFGGTFDDENFVLRHDKPFLLSMANRGKNTNGSQFFITLNPAPHLDGVHVVFGHVLSGQQIVNEIQEQSTGEDGKPLLDVLITNCGELIPQIKPKDKKKKHKKLSKKSDGELSSDEEDRDDTKAKKKKKHKKHKKSKENKKDENNEVNKEDKEVEQLNDNCSVKPEEIPDIPENTFLLDERERLWEPKGYNRFSSRRKVKGRGPTRYRTPSPHHYRSGSETPPHWRHAQANLKTLKEVITEQKESRDNREAYREVYSKGRKPSTSGYHREREKRRNNYRDLDFHKTNQRESSDTEMKNNISGQPYQKRKFTEEPQFSSKHSKSDSYSNKISNRREPQNENNVTSYVSDSENIKNTEIQRHSVKSEVKMSVRNKRGDSRERLSEEHKQQSPSDIKNIPLPDSDTEKRNPNQKLEKKRSERTYDSHSRGPKREYRYRRSDSHEKDFSQKLWSRRRRHSNDSN